MKLSEAIRNAVDTRLANNDDLSEISKYFTLFWVFDGVMSLEERRKINGEEDAMLRMMPYDLNERQNLRFMYAEFLALEAEDNETELAINSRIIETQIG